MGRWDPFSTTLTRWLRSVAGTDSRDAHHSSGIATHIMLPAIRRGRPRCTALPLRRRLRQQGVLQLRSRSRRLRLCMAADYPMVERHAMWRRPPSRSGLASLLVWANTTMWATAWRVLVMKASPPKAPVRLLRLARFLWKQGELLEHRQACQSPACTSLGKLPPISRCEASATTAAAAVLGSCSATTQAFRRMLRCQTPRRY